MLINLKEIQIGIIGGGVVGAATAKAWVEHVKQIRVYDVDSKKRTHELKEVCEHSDFVFICLPTNEKEDGSCDTSIIEDLFDNMDLYNVPDDTTFVIKSTVPIGFTKKLYNSLSGDYRLVHSPEFLTARCSLIDSQIPSRNIVGTPDAVSKEYIDLVNLYTERFPQTQLIIMDSNDSEAVKLICNSFFAVKISFFNEIYKKLYSEIKFIDEWDTVMEGVLSDGRISPSHTKVPGPDGGFGFGGTCLPKDITNLNNLLGSKLLETVIKLNKEHRNIK